MNDDDTTVALLRAGYIVGTRSNTVQTGATKMTKHKKVAPDPLLDALTDELIAMTDEQVLAGEDPALVLAQGRDLLAKAGADAGKRRLAAAKTAVEARRRSPPGDRQEARSCSPDHRPAPDTRDHEDGPGA